MLSEAKSFHNFLPLWETILYFSPDIRFNKVISFRYYVSLKKHYSKDFIQRLILVLPLLVQLPR
jgi:hypothetical protein